VGNTQVKVKTTRALLALATAAALAGGGWGAAPAHAAAGIVTSCSAYEVSYGVTPDGALDEHYYCTDAAHEGLERVEQAAGPGWWLGGTVFSGGNDPYANGSPNTFYQVSPHTGQLLRYEKTWSDPMSAGQPIGSAFGDWRSYQSLFADDYRGIFGIDSRGYLLHWTYRSDLGDDQWDGPTALLRGFTGREHLAGVTGADPVTAGADPVAVGTDPAAPGRLVRWSAAGEARGETITGLPDAPVLTRTKHGTLYGRARDGALARLRQADGTGDPSQWAVPLRMNGSYAVVFAGDSFWVKRPRPYEWQ
jgi:hypothetical protein